MSFKKKDIISVTSKLGKRIKKNGEREVIGSVLTNNDGEVRVVLNPAGKAAKFAMELKTGKRYTNGGKVKVDWEGKPLPLTEKQRRFRVGYLQSRKDNANAFKAKKGGNK